MAIDLNDLIDDMKSEVDAPGTDSFPDSTDDDWLTQLRNGFWEARLDGMLAGYEERDGIIATGFTLVIDEYVPDAGVDLSRDLQQLIILYAGLRVVRNQMRALTTRFHAKAGPVEFETEHSAIVLKALLDELRTKRNVVLQRLSDLGSANSYYIDAILGRELAIRRGLNWQWE